MEKASKGNTQVYMNSRELGKIELTVLKMAGVHCLPGTHLWVAEDGSYREEGQTRSKGSLWAHVSPEF
jgi:2-keto-3-deoxy-galactonokinase